MFLFPWSYSEYILETNSLTNSIMFPLLWSLLLDRISQRIVQSSSVYLYGKLCYYSLYFLNLSIFLRCGNPSPYGFWSSFKCILFIMYRNYENKVAMWLILDLFFCEQLVWICALFRCIWKKIFLICEKIS